MLIRFDEQGKLVARFKFERPSGDVFVILRSVVNAFPKKASETKVDRRKRYFAYLKSRCLKMSTFYSDFGSKYVNGKRQFPASSISVIYTQILKDFNFDITKLQNGKLFFMEVKAIDITMQMLKVESLELFIKESIHLYNLEHV